AAALTAVVVTPVVWQENAIARTRSENPELAVKAEPLPQLRAEQNQLAAQPAPEDEAGRAARERAELDRLRAEVGSLRNQVQQTQAAQVAARNSAAAERKPTALPPGYISLLDAHDVGAATGESLMQTFLCAMRNGDT